MRASRDRRHRRKYSQLDLRLAKPGPVAGDNDIATGNQFAAAAQCRTVHYRNRGFGNLRQQTKNVVKGIEHLEDGFRKMLFDRDSGTERSGSGRGIKDYGHHVAIARIDQSPR